MNRLNKAQKQKASEFVNVTGQSSAVALECLRAENWNTAAAVDRYFQNPGFFGTAPRGGRSGAAAAEAEAFFKQYQEDAETMDAAGIERLIEDLGIEPTDKVLVVFSFHCGAENMGAYTRAEFLRGCAATQGTSLEKLRAQLPALRRQLDDAATFAAVYEFAYHWACEPGKKLLGHEVAIALWQLLFSGTQAWAFLEPWCTFVAEHHQRPVIVDTWRLLLEFKRANETDFNNFDESEAWPVLIDEFVEHMQSQGR